MGTLGRWRISTRVVLAIALLASLVITPAVSAQQDQFRGTWTFLSNYTDLSEPLNTSVRRNEVTIETGRLVSALQFSESAGNQTVRPWVQGDSGAMSYDMVLKWYVPDLDSDSSGMLTGNASGRISFVYDEAGARGDTQGDRELAPGALTWTGKVEGFGECDGDGCLLDLVIAAKLADADGRGNCGDVNIVLGVFIDYDNIEIGLVPHESSLTTDLRTSNRDGLHCYIGETEKNLGTAEIGFYYGEPVAENQRPAPYPLGTPDRILSGRSEVPPARVMPGDNVKLFYSGIPMQIQERHDLRGGEPLLGSRYAIAGAEHDMEIDLRFGGRSNEEVRIDGVVSGSIIVLDQDVEDHTTSLYGVSVEGAIQGSGSYDPRAGVYRIRISGDLILTGKELRNSRTNCGMMAINVNGTLKYDGGPQMTLMPNGSGSISADVTCILDSFESWDDI
jgi:hypothetical protein